MAKSNIEGVEDAQAFRRFLQGELDRRDWKQADFIRETGISKAAVSKWLDHADPIVPDIFSLMHISLTLHIGIGTILSYPYPGRFFDSTLSADARLLGETFDKLPEGVRNSVRVLMLQAFE